MTTPAVPAPPLSQPELATPRLRLRPFDRLDVDALQRLANDRDVAGNTLSIPHPYHRRDAEAWIASQPGQLETGDGVSYAVTLRTGGELAGAVGLMLDLEQERAELGYWIGRPFWGRGYATEAAGALVAWGFDALGLRRIHASHFPHNPASGRVLRKLGMRREGRQRQHILKGGEPLDLVHYGLLRQEWAAREGREGRTRESVVEPPAVG